MLFFSVVPFLLLGRGRAAEQSTDANVRVWDLSSEEKQKQTKPSFRDISNSKDTRIVFGDYAYGGATVLSLVKLDAPPVANRMEIGERHRKEEQVGANATTNMFGFNFPCFAINWVGALIPECRVLPSCAVWCFAFNCCPARGLF